MALAVLAGGLAPWLVLFALVLGPVAVATVLWGGVLASSRLRSLFRALPFSGSTGANYVLTAAALSVPWLAGLAWAFHEIGSRPDAAGEPLLNVAALLAVTYVVALPLLAGAGLPRLGIDWDENGYGPGTWLLLVVASAWYSAIFAVPTFLAGIVVSLPF